MTHEEYMRAIELWDAIPIAAAQADEAEVASPLMDSTERDRSQALVSPSESPMSAVPEPASAAPVEPCLYYPGLCSCSLQGKCLEAV